MDAQDMPTWRAMLLQTQAAALGLRSPVYWSLRPRSGRPQQLQHLSTKQYANALTLSTVEPAQIVAASTWAQEPRIGDTSSGGRDKYDFPLHK